MPSHGDLGALLRTARQLSKLCQQGAALVQEARDHRADGAAIAAARQIHSELLRTKHAVEDELVSFVLDCERCGPARALGSRGRVRPRAVGPLGAGVLLIRPRIDPPVGAGNDGSGGGCGAEIVGALLSLLRD